MTAWKQMYLELKTEYDNVQASIRNLDFKRILPAQLMLSKQRWRFEDMDDGRMQVTNLNHPLASVYLGGN